MNGTIEESQKNEIREGDKYGIIHYNGYLDHKSSIEISMNSDMLVLFGSPGAGADIVYTGKVFEYLRMNRPILCFSRPGGVLDRLLEGTGRGKNFAYDDLEGVGRYIMERYRAWEDGAGFECPADAIGQYSRESEAGRLAEVFDGLVAG